VRTEIKVSFHALLLHSVIGVVIMGLFLV